MSNVARPDESGIDPYLRLLDCCLAGCVLLNLTVMVPAAMPHRIIGYLAAGLLLARLLYRASGLAVPMPAWRRRGVTLLLTMLASLLVSGTLLAGRPLRETPWLEWLHLALALALPLGLTLLLAIGVLHRRGEMEQ
ncbi:hypothetical protein QU487_04835 [Crenobacter sp. SG2305]|uniref:hypothetical protein n=1 Tax=Crenobacter oryzisoli TaxID=3056844 RepID=UPI0025AB1FE7|nr:hypothetical protein [Crenobacter sp. SG2305]MDN0082079.1 hypothetical protein [Crenobacter sp. SG2305]